MFNAARSAFVLPNPNRPIAEENAAPVMACHDEIVNSSARLGGSAAR